MTSKETNRDLFKRIEQTLFEVPALRASIENIKLDLEDLKEINVLAATGTNKPSTPTNAFNSSVENEAIRLTRVEDGEQYKSLLHELRRTERKLKRIENIVNTLCEKEKRLIEMKYYEKRTVNYICDMLGYTSEQGYSAKKRQIIVSLMPLFKDII